MIKFCTLNNLNQYIGWSLCHSISINGKEYSKYSKITNEMIKGINLLQYKTSLEEMVLVSSNEETNDENILPFIIQIFMDLTNKEIQTINKKYVDIIDEKSQSGILSLLKTCIEELNIKYLIYLACNPIILKKTLDLSILGFYFGLKCDLKYIEMKDIMNTSLLCNIEVCLNPLIYKIETSNREMISNINNQKITSYDYIKDDENLNNHVKVLVKLFNTNYLEKISDKYTKDIIIEILWLSNDLLTYDFRVGKNFQDIYSTDKYAMIMPEANSFLKNVKMQKQKNILKKFLNIFK